MKVGATGYGTIGMRLAEEVALQEDMEMVSVVGLAPTLAVRALHEAGMYYDFRLVDMARKSQFVELGIPVTGSIDDLLAQIDVALDATPRGIGAKASCSTKNTASRLPGRRKE